VEKCIYTVETITEKTKNLIFDLYNIDVKSKEENLFLEPYFLDEVKVLCIVFEMLKYVGALDTRISDSKLEESGFESINKIGEFINRVSTNAV